MRGSSDDEGDEDDWASNSSQYDTELIQAASESDLRRVQDRIHIFHDDVNASEDGETALLIAASGGDDDWSPSSSDAEFEQSDSHLIVKVLIAAGADVNCANEMGHTPLINAAICSSIPTMKILIEAGAVTDAAADDCVAVDFASSSSERAGRWLREKIEEIESLFKVVCEQCLAQVVFDVPPVRSSIALAAQLSRENMLVMFEKGADIANRRLALANMSDMQLRVMVAQTTPHNRVESARQVFGQELVKQGLPTGCR